MITRLEIDALARAVRRARRADLDDAVANAPPDDFLPAVKAAHARFGNCTAVLDRLAESIPPTE